jgi:alpha-L-fucosidase
MTFVTENGSVDLFALELIWTDNAWLLSLKDGVKDDLCVVVAYIGNVTGKSIYFKDIIIWLRIYQTITFFLWHQ